MTEWEQVLADLADREQEGEHWAQEAFRLNKELNRMQDALRDIMSWSNDERAVAIARRVLAGQCKHGRPMEYGDDTCCGWR